MADRGHVGIGEEASGANVHGPPYVSAAPAANGCGVTRPVVSRGCAVVRSNREEPREMRRIVDAARLLERLGSSRLSQISKAQISKAQISKAISWIGGTRPLPVRRAGGSMEIG